MFVRSARTFAALAALTLSAPAMVSAQAAPSVSPGMLVVDPSGASVGTVVSVNGQQLVVKTDKHEVQLPATSFTASEGKLLFALTQAQLNAQTDQALTEANAKLASGATVYGQAGTAAGTIEAIDDTTVTVKLTSGKLIRMPRNAIAPGRDGAVLGVSAAELEKLASQGQ